MALALGRDQRRPVGDARLVVREMLLLCSAVNFIQSPSDVFGPVALLEPTSSAARDFSAVVSEAPIAVMQPGSPADIARLLGALSSSSSSGPRVAARGAGHSLHGQAQARGGIVVETRALPRLVEVVRRGDGDYADVGGGALWVEVLEACLRAGLAPRSWTDYLHLTVGGTLSNGGISGQAFKHGFGGLVCAIAADAARRGRRGPRTIAFWVLGWS